ncbi:MAG: hypothetical protein DCC57_06590 [Chloroflexi bacterium]|nr:MAG: hypothetical protein DCC57_06590 [Chloroflexota bacterium]
MLQRQTQTAAFWRDQFEVTSSDLDFLYTLLLDAQTPKTLEELSLALIQEYMRRENSKIESELAKGKVYLPKERYEVGQTLVFPALDFATGEVIGVRAGQNPEHGDFEVIKVRFAATGQPREFAAGLQSAHRLNQTNGDRLIHDEAMLSAEEVYSLYAGEIDESILYALEEGERSEEFVQVGDQWLLADMLAEVHVGHLNIAEALIEVKGRPLTTDELLADVELDANAGASMQRISLEHALAKDPRFDRVQRDGEPAWFLTRMEPAEVVKTPLALRPTSVRYNRALLSVELLQTEWELDDEWGESTLSSELPTIVPNTSLTLTYPHRRCGTLPLNGRTRSFFPTGGGKATIQFVDGRWSAQYTGWVVNEGRYVTGLGKWMEDHALPVGAIITLERTANPGEILVDFRTRRPKREWARIATPDLDNLRLTFEMNKIQVACEYDEAMIVADTDPEAIDQLREKLVTSSVELPEIVEQIVPELTKLNPAGTVHAKTVYSAVNIVRRCPPGPIFYLLISNPRFRDVGGGFFALA